MLKNRPIFIITHSDFHHVTGIFDTPMTTELLKIDGLMDKALVPKRPGKPEEVAALVQHIVENKYMNAAVIRLDAGIR